MIKFNQLTKLLRDHAVDHSMINKHEMESYLKVINNSMLSRHDIDGCEYQAFV